MKTIRWGIIGLGRFGNIHAQTVQSILGSELAAVCHHNRDRLQAAADSFPQAAATTDYREILDSPDVDIVSITTHWQQHFELACAALKCGKNVFLEKPMAATGEQCIELVNLAQQSGGQLMVGHICRFDTRVTQAKHAIDQGHIGQIVSMHAKRNLPAAPGHIRLDKISPLMGDGIHDADLMMWFLRQAPSRIYAKNVHCGSFEYPDLGWAMLEFGSRAVGVIETIWCLPPNVPTVIDARMEVVGTEGMLTIDCSQTGFHIINSEGSTMADTAYWPVQYGQRVGALARELSYFADCVRERRAVTVITPAEAAAAVAVMEKAEQSAATGRPVDLTSIVTGFEPGETP